MKKTFPVGLTGAGAREVDSNGNQSLDHLLALQATGSKVACGKVPTGHNKLEPVPLWQQDDAMAGTGLSVGSRQSPRGRESKGLGKT